MYRLSKQPGIKTTNTNGAPYGNIAEDTNFRHDP